MRKPRKKSIHWIWDGEHKKKQDVVDARGTADMTGMVVLELEKVLAVLKAEGREEVFTFALDLPLDLQGIWQTEAPAAADRQAWNAPR